MSVKQEANGRRSVQVEFEVAGTPEEVWQAIATGPGISSWFVPAEFEERDGKPVAMKLKFGPGMEPSAAVTAWDPPRTFAAQNEGWGGSPPIATEWSVEARAGGLCLVRIVHSLFASTDEWDNQLKAPSPDGQVSWPFCGSTSRTSAANAPRSCRSPLPPRVRTRRLGGLTAGLGVRLERRQRWTTPAGVSPLGGVVEYLTENPYGTAPC